MTQRAVVIGSGVAGLTAATVLSLLDYDVTLLEQARVASPLLRGFTRTGHYCDVGLHYTGGLAPGGLLRQLFDHLGIGEDVVEPVAMRSSGFDRLLWPEHDLDVEIPCGLNAAEQCLRQTFPSSSDALKRYFAAVRRVLEETPLLNPEVPPWKAQRSPWDRSSVVTVLKEFGAERRLIATLGRYGSFLYGIEETRAPFLTNAAVLGSYFVSAHTVKGGGMALADALLSRFCQLGGQYRCNCRVQRLLSSADGRLTGVTLTNDEYIAADTAVFTPHPSLLPAMLPDPAMARSYNKRLAKMSNSPGMLLAFIAGSPHAASDQNTYLFSDGTSSSTPQHGNIALMPGSPPAPGLNRSRCLIRSLEIGELGDAGPSARHRRPDRYRETKRRLAQETAAQAHRYLPHLDAHTEFLEILTPYSFAEWTGTGDGSAYGLQRTVGGRRMNSLTPLGGLFLAGQSILFPGIMGSVASALVACCHIAGSKRTWKALFQ